MAPIECIKNVLSKEECEKILVRSVKHPTKFLSYEITNFHENVAGFLSENLLLTIKFITNSSTTQTITYFMKVLPQTNPDQLEYVRAAGIFKKEVQLYKNLLPELMNITQFGPKCYFVRDDCIVLENLNNKGLKMRPRLEYFDKTRCDSMLKTLAKFHSASIIFEYKNQVEIDVKFRNEIQETCYNFIEGQPRQKWCVSTTKCVTDLLEMVSINNAATLGQQFKKFVFGEFQQFIQPSKQFKNVFTHDDLWCNNMLFSDNECVFVDYQLGRFTPPVLDFLLSLYLTLEWNYIVDHFDKLIETYHDYLTQELKLYNLEEQLTKTEFQESVEVYKLAALTEATMYGTHVYISEDLANRVVADFESYKEFSFINRSKFAVAEFRDNPHYRERLGNLLVALGEELSQKTTS